MNPFEEKKADTWLKSLKDGSASGDELDRAIINSARKIFRAGEAGETGDLDTLKSQFLFRLKKEGLWARETPARRRNQWIAVAATVALAVLVVPQLIDRPTGPYPIDMGQVKSISAFRYQQTGPNSFRATKTLSNSNILEAGIRDSLVLSPVEFTFQVDGRSSIFSFELSEDKLVGFNEQFEELGLELPRAGHWEIILQEQ